MSPQRKTLAIFAFVTAVIAFAVFANAPRRAPAPAPAMAKPRVAATIFPVYDIVRNVAGDLVDVMLVLPPGAEPHSFEPTPTTVRELSSAKAVYAVGHGIDDWIDRVSTSETTEKIVVDRDIALRQATRGIALGDEEDAAHEDGAVDPHYWLTAENALQIASTVVDDLSERFPEDAHLFRDNYQEYWGELFALELEMRATLASSAGKNIVTFHDAWYYFADEYELRIVGTFEPSPGREPTPRGIATLKETVERNGVKTLYTEPLFSDAAISSFARDSGLTLAAIDDIGGAPGRDSYVSLMRYNAEIISQNQ